MNIPIYVKHSPAVSYDYSSESVILEPDNWDDFGLKTLFKLYYTNGSGSIEDIGSIKIYHMDSSRTSSVLGNDITQLNEKFCSLGQDILFYEKLKKYLPNHYLSVLRRLNDIATNSELGDKFFRLQGVQTSLFRFSGAEKAYNEASNILNNRHMDKKDISFSYSCKLPYSSIHTIIDFDFSPNPYLPYRINILVGKNGAGKTQILRSLVELLSGLAGIVDKHDAHFVRNRPPVDRVMSISYSAFDDFRKPPSDPFVTGENENTIENRSLHSYVYCGIQSEKGTLSLSELKRNFISALNIVKKRDRYETWKDILSSLIEEEHVDIINEIEMGSNDINWSSGQHIAISTITELVAKIESESIILFDEPEIHLHPNAIANVMRMYYRLLEEFDSYAIFSTHSPIIIQETPSKYIRVLSRVNNLLTVRQPVTECFGNNISDIVNDIFSVGSAESNYKSILSMLSKDLNYNEITALFDRGLSLNAMIFLKNSCFGGRIDE